MFLKYSFYIRIVHRNTACTAKQGVASMIELVADENVDIVVGAICSSGKSVVNVVQSIV